MTAAVHLYYFVVFQYVMYMCMWWANRIALYKLGVIDNNKIIPLPTQNNT